MTQEEFIKILKNKKYSYKIDGDKLMVTGGNKDGSVGLDGLTTLPPDVVFKNGGSVFLNDLTTLPPGVVFENEEDIWLSGLTTLPPEVEFKNGGHVRLNDLTTLPPGVVFKNGEYVYLEALFGGWFNDWNGNIEGINSTRLLNGMIKGGVFER